MTTTLSRYTTSLLSRTVIPRRTISASPRSFTTRSVFRSDLLRHKPTPLSLIFTRTVASTVSNKPGSQTLPHAAQNIKEETGNSATDFAKTIAGNVPLSDAFTPEKYNFLGITSIIAGTVPKPIMIMGLMGSLPYLGTALTSAYLARQAGLAASGMLASINPETALGLLMDCLHVQVTYGAVLLSFTAAIHWGFEFSNYHGSKGYPRLMLGALPVVYAWSTLALDPMMALAAQWVGFTTLWFADMKATSAGWTPKWYSQYRFYLSILVGTCIIGTLAASSYFGPYPGHGAAKHELDVTRNKRRATRGDFADTVQGSIEAVPAGEEADAYVKIAKKKEPEEAGTESGSEAEAKNTEQAEGSH